MSTPKSLRRRAAELLASCTPKECRCVRDPDPEPVLRPGVTVVEEHHRHDGPLLRARCGDCGGEYLVQVVEVVVTVHRNAEARAEDLRRFGPHIPDDEEGLVRLRLQGPPLPSAEVSWLPPPDPDAGEPFVVEARP